jgi:hypothetical protein
MKSFQLRGSRRTLSNDELIWKVRVRFGIGREDGFEKWRAADRSFLRSREDIGNGGGEGNQASINPTHHEEPVERWEASLKPENILTSTRKTVQGGTRTYFVQE